MGIGTPGKEYHKGTSYDLNADLDYEARQILADGKLNMDERYVLDKVLKANKGNEAEVAKKTTRKNLEALKKLVSLRKDTRDRINNILSMYPPLDTNLREWSKISKTKQEKLIGKQVQWAAKQLGVDANLIAALTYQEVRDGNPFATRLEKSYYQKYKNKGYSEKNAKHMGSSEGLFQIMGYNYKDAGFPNLNIFITSLKTSLHAHFEAFVNFVKNNKIKRTVNGKRMNLLQALKTHSYEHIARIYNGPNYKKNNYAAHLKKFSNPSENPYM